MSTDDAIADDQLRETLARVTARLPAGGEDRPGQVEMALAVGNAISTGRHLAVQAGTGTGKSLGYLVPAAISGRRVVVATATKALQDQLAERDLPLVGEALGNSFTWAVLKGRNNYLCRQRAGELGEHGFQAELDETEADPVADGPEPESIPEEVLDASGASDVSREMDADGAAMGLADQVRWLVRWGETATTGDRSDLPFEPRPRAWSAVSVGPRECPGAFRCPSGPHCFAESAHDPRGLRRRRGGQPPPVRRARRQWGSGAPAARRGGVRRGPPARGRDDRHARRRPHPRTPSGPRRGRGPSCRRSVSGKRTISSSPPSGSRPCSANGWARGWTTPRR